jgi:hypothetical protein
MVHSSTLAIATDGEHLMCDGFSLDETIRFGSLEFIIDCFDSVSLSPKGSDSSAIFVGRIHSRSPSLRAMIEESTNMFYMASSGEGSSNLPISWRHGTGAPPTPITATTWLEDAPTTQTMTMVPPWTLTPRPDTGLPLERQHTFREGQ